jgi:hypothetical protein
MVAITRTCQLPNKPFSTRGTVSNTLSFGEGRRNEDRETENGSGRIGCALANRETTDFPSPVPRFSFFDLHSI